MQAGHEVVIQAGTTRTAKYPFGFEAQPLFSETMITYNFSSDDIDGASIGLLVLVKGGNFSLMISFLSVSFFWFVVFRLQQLLQEEGEGVNGRKERERG